MGMARRPAEELYDLTADPDELKNLATDPAYAKVKMRLAKRLNEHLTKTGDPRARGENPWDAYPFH